VILDGVRLGSVTRVLGLAAASLILFAGPALAGPQPSGVEQKSLGPASSRGAPGAAGESLPLRSSSPESKVGGSTLQTVAALGGVITVILIAGVVVKRVARRGGGLLGALGPGGRAPSGLMEILGRYPVGRGATLVLLKVDRRILLLCQGGGKLGGAGMTTLSEITDPEEVASILLKTRDEEGDSMARRFQSVLRGEEQTAAEVLDAPPATRSAAAITGPDSFELSQARAKSKPVAAIRTRLDSLRTSKRPVQGAAAR
jgi:flagellar biogenesis protein FliO